MALKISVIIGTMGRLPLLKKTLQALEKQTFPKAHFEVIVATNAEDGTCAWVKKINKEKRLNAICIFHDNRWVGPKRNAALKLVKSPIVAFTDDDCIPDVDWLQSIYEAFQSNSKLVSVEGLTYSVPHAVFEHATVNESGRIYPTCNLAFRKTALTQVNGFDERYTYHREDTDLAFKVMDLGQVTFNTNVKVFHPPRPTQPVSILKELFWVKGDILLFKKFKDRYVQHFGFVCKGSFKQSTVIWALIAAFIYGAFFSPVISVLSIAAFIIFRYFVSLYKRKISPVEVLIFYTFTLIRDVLFPFAFIYYYLTVR